MALRYTLRLCHRQRQITPQLVKPREFRLPAVINHLISRIMERKEITVNGYTFSVESTLGDENCYRLMYGGITVIDDTACEDFYGDIDAVADVMAEYAKEETEKPFPWLTLLDAIVEQGSDPTRIESDKDYDLQ